MIEIAAADGTAEAYLATPGGEGPWPGVLFFIDAIGLRPQIESMADRIASWGYAVLAPNLFYRLGSAAALAPTSDLRLPGEREKFFATVGPRITTPAADLQRDISAYLAAMRGLAEISDTPIGTTGYCMGARLATWAAGQHSDDVAACGGFHGGRLVSDGPTSPHLSLATARASFVYGFADNDGSMPADAIAVFEAALHAAGLTAKSSVYEGCVHGYTMADTSMYSEAGAERHYRELRELLDSTIGRR